MEKVFKSRNSLLVLAFVASISGCGGDGSASNSTGDNSSISPSASAGSDIAVNKYSAVSLDASLSNDATSYKWLQTEGPTVNLSDDESVTPEFIPKSAATYRFTLQATNENGSDTDEIIVVSQEISTVSFTSPTFDEAITISQSPIAISGSTGQYITSVILKNKTTGASYDGSLDGNGSFSIGNVDLQSGDNVFELVGTDNTGTLSKDTLLVTYNNSVNFLSSPAFSVDSGFINDDVETIVSIAIDENQNIISDGVNLAELDSNGTTTTIITTLYDDGNVANGDDIAGDGVYSRKVILNKSEAAIYNYRVAVNTGVTEYSSPIYFTVLTPLTDQDIQSADETTEAAFTDNFPAVGSKFTQSEFDTYKHEILAELLSLSDVADAQFSTDENSIVIVFNSGLIHTIDFVYADTKSGSRSANYVSNLSTTSQPKLSYQPSSLKTNLSYMPIIKAAAPVVSSQTKIQIDSIGSYRSLALSPFKWQFEPYDDIDGAYVKIQNSSSPNFSASTPITDYDVTVEHFKNLSQYSVVVISSHGGLDGSNPVIYTSEEATLNKQKSYQKDIVANRLMISHKITILVEDGGFFWFDSKESKKVFKIAPSFITKYNNNMPNTLVYMSICQGVSNNGLANAFINAGAGAFIGYTDIVNASYAYNAGQTFFDSMIDGKTVKEAVKDATDAHGINDGDNTPAAFVYRGNGDLILERTGIQNGGFEDNLKYWEQNGGDIRILSKLSSLSPQEGSFMTILSSGLGSVSDSEAVITQQFKIPANVNFLTFNYDVVSEEPMEYVGSSYDDKFRAVLMDEDGNEIELAYETVNTSSWSAIDGSQSDGGIFDGGDTTPFHTGWKSINYQINSLAGQTVTLKFSVWDVGDSEFDTAALIDSISLQ